MDSKSFVHNCSIRDRYRFNNFRFVHETPKKKSVNESSTANEIKHETRSASAPDLQPDIGRSLGRVARRT